MRTKTYKKLHRLEQPCFKVWHLHFFTKDYWSEAPSFKTRHGKVSCPDNSDPTLLGGQNYGSQNWSSKVHNQPEILSWDISATSHHGPLGSWPFRAPNKPPGDLDSKPSQPPTCLRCWPESEQGATADLEEGDWGEERHLVYRDNWLIPKPNP